MTANPLEGIKPSSSSRRTPVYSPPPCGEGWGGGSQRARHLWLPPTPTLPRKGGGRTSSQTKSPVLRPGFFSFSPFSGAGFWALRASGSKRVNLTSNSRESVLDRDLNVFVPCVVDRRMIDNDVLVQRNGQPNVDLKASAVAMLVAWCNNGYAASGDALIVGLQPFDLF
jgi:hypothetical protein